MWCFRFQWLWLWLLPIAGMWRRIIWRLICYAPASQRNMLGIGQVQDRNVPETVGYSSALRNYGSCVSNCTTACPGRRQSANLKQTKRPCNQFKMWKVMPVQTWIKITHWKRLTLDIYSSAHHLCKMWIFYEPRRVTLGNTRHFV